MFPPPKAKQLVAEFQASYLHMKGSFCEVTQMVTQGTEFLGLSLALGHWTSHCVSGPQCSRLIRKGLHYTISIASFFSFFISKSISVVVWYNLNWVKLKSHFCEEFWLRVVHRAIAMTSGGRSVAAPAALGRRGGFRAGLCCCSLLAHAGVAHSASLSPAGPLSPGPGTCAALCPGHQLLFCGARQLRASGHREAHVRGSLFLGFFFARVAPTVFAHFHWASSCLHDPPALLTPSRPSQMWKFGTPLCWALGRDSSLFHEVIPFWTLTSSVSHCWISSNPCKKNPYSISLIKFCFPDYTQLM